MAAVRSYEITEVMSMVYPLSSPPCPAGSLSSSLLLFLELNFFVLESEDRWKRCLKKLLTGVPDYISVCSHALCLSVLDLC